MATTYATFVLGYLEVKLYACFEQIFEPEGNEYIVKNIKGFMDDVIRLWDKDTFGDVIILFAIIYQ